MHLKIDKSSNIPIYEQIYIELRHKILTGAYTYGTKLPSKRMIAKDNNISITTVEHALMLLCEEDYCEMRLRSGCYCIYSPQKNFPFGEKNDTLPGKEDSTDFHYDNIPYSSFAKHIRKVLLDRGENLFMRSPNNGCIELREAICRYLGRSRNIKVSPQQIIIGSGAEYLYGLCIQMLGRDKLIALEDPSYEKIRSVYNANGAKCEMLPMGNDGIKSESLKNSQASILHVTPFKSYPSNITASAEKRDEYIKWAKQRNGFLIEDDYASEFILTGNAPETLFSLSKDENVIYINTFSKTIAPSIRAGYMLLPESLLKLYSEKIGFYSCSVPMLEQYFLADWIESGDFERTITRIRHKNNFYSKRH